MINEQEFLKLVYYVQDNYSNAACSVRKVILDYFQSRYFKIERKHHNLKLKIVNRTWDNEQLKYHVINYADFAEISPKSAINNFPMQGKRQKIFTENEATKIQEMYNQGVSKRQIAKAMSVNEKTIRNYLQQNKVI